MSVDLTQEGERCGFCYENKAYLTCKVEGCALLEDKKLFSVFEAKENNVFVRFRHDELTHKFVAKFHKGDLIILDEKDFKILPKKTDKPFGNISYGRDGGERKVT